jgi:hypothetical protein
MNSVERNYSVEESELLIIVKTCKQWRHYLEDAAHQVRVITNHVNLRTFLIIKNLSRRETRWWERLFDLNLAIEYRSERLNVANALSRRRDYMSVKESEKTQNALTLSIRSESSISCIASVLNSKESNDKNVISLNYWMIADASDFIRDSIKMTTKSESHLNSLAFCSNSDNETSSSDNEFINVITRAQRARFFAIEKTMITSQSAEILVTQKIFISQ